MASAQGEYLNAALHNLILNAHYLGFEHKKDVFTILEESLKSSQPCVDYFTTHACSIVHYLLAQ